MSGLPRPRQMLALAAAAVLALACIASAADRGGTGTRLLPARLAPGATLETARQAAVAGDRAAGTRAGAAVAAHPINADALALLGAAALADGDATTADAAFTAAAQLGWRNPATQLYWFTVGLGLGDARVTAERLDALLRTGHRSRATELALATLEASPRGRAALAAQLAQAPAWRDAFAADTATLSGAALDRRVAVLARARSAGMQVDCGALTAAVKTLVARGSPHPATRLWRATCAAGAAASEAASRTARDK